VADVHDALVSRRPCKEPMSRDQAAGVIEGESGRHFDPKLVEVFREVKEKFKTWQNVRSFVGNGVDKPQGRPAKGRFRRERPS
jgi:response regulator RpfG family c-di-GMP phosphodiesterase